MRDFEDAFEDEYLDVHITDDAPEHPRLRLPRPISADELPAWELRPAARYVKNARQLRARQNGDDDEPEAA